MKRIATMIAGAALAATALVGVQMSQPAPAQAASCRYSQLGWWSVKNDSCKSVQHVSLTASGFKYGGKAATGKKSVQSACWVDAYNYRANVTI